MTNILEFGENQPQIAPGCFIADSARIIGAVVLEEAVSIWFGAVLRGDVGSITVGPRSNIQDLACVHMTDGVSNVRIGADVTVGHGAIIHGADVGDGCLIGMGSILLDNVVIGAECVIGAGTLITANKKIPPRSLVLGNPGRVVRELNEGELAQTRKSAPHYEALAARYLHVRT